MKSKFSIVVKRQFFCVVVLAAALIFTSKAAIAQTTGNSAAKPKAILVAEWTNTEPSSQIEGLSARRSPTRARIANNQRFTAAQAVISRVETAGASDTLKGRFPSLKPTALEEQAFAFVNEQRRLQKLEPLKLDLEMLYLARQHSENMAQLNFFSHVGRDGKTVDERAHEIGVTDWNSIGENIAFNQGFKNNVEFAVQCWIKSPSHKQNLLGKNWLRSGIGIAETPEGKFYITQVFRN
ncbi:MAG: CAP domain-containing protein [Pyrinomonadaceae bacterium]